MSCTAMSNDYSGTIWKLGARNLGVQIKSLCKSASMKKINSLQIIVNAEEDTWTKFSKHM